MTPQEVNRQKAALRRWMVDAEDEYDALQAALGPLRARGRGAPVLLPGTQMRVHQDDVSKTPLLPGSTPAAGSPTVPATDEKSSLPALGKTSTP
jgi:hypothetical protein